LGRDWTEIGGEIGGERRTSDPDLHTRSEPARSTIERRPRRTAMRGALAETTDERSESASSPVWIDARSAAASSVDSVHCSTRSSSSACERLEVRFIEVPHVARLVALSCTSASTASGASTGCSVSPST
jgi:hypothetical protein